MDLKGEIVMAELLAIRQQTRLESQRMMTSVLNAGELMTLMRFLVVCILSQDFTTQNRPYPVWPYKIESIRYPRIHRCRHLAIGCLYQGHNGQWRRWLQ